MASYYAPLGTPADRSAQISRALQISPAHKQRNPTHAANELILHRRLAQGPRVETVSRAFLLSDTFMIDSATLSVIISATLSTSPTLSREDIKAGLLHGSGALTPLRQLRETQEPIAISTMAFSTAQERAQVPLKDSAWLQGLIAKSVLSPSTVHEPWQH